MVPLAFLILFIVEGAVLAVGTPIAARNAQERQQAQQQQEQMVVPPAIPRR
jgi:biopolymer transport protein ExbD